MYGNPLITPELIRQRMEETQKVYGTRPLPDSFWYKLLNPQPLFQLARRPRAVVMCEESCECEAC